MAVAAAQALPMQGQIGRYASTGVLHWAVVAQQLAHRPLQERLHARLHSLELAFHPALGCNNQGGMVEHGCLVLDASLDQADALAREFGQGGTLFWEAEAPVRLRMMWPRPPQADGDPHTDWVG